LEEAIEWAADDKLPEFQYYTGYAHAMSGENGRALKWMRDMSPEPLDPLFEEWALLTGQLMVGSLSYDQALDVFDSYLAVYPRGKYLQPILFLAGVSRTELGDLSEGTKLFEQVVEIDPASEWGQLAKSRLSAGN
jgi:tetratricopeptide (TPR) repeat protein